MKVKKFIYKCKYCGAVSKHEKISKKKWYHICEKAPSDIGLGSSELILQEKGGK